MPVHMVHCIICHPSPGISPSPHVIPQLSQSSTGDSRWFPPQDGCGGPIHRQHHALRHGGAADRGTATGARDQQPTLAEDARGCPGADLAIWDGDLEQMADGKLNKKPRFTGWDYIILVVIIPIIVVIYGD